MLYAAVWGAALAAAAFIIKNPVISADAALAGLKTGAFYVVPSLFPFMAVVNLLCSTGFAEFAGRFFEKPFRAFFRLGGVCAPALAAGLAAGFPLGAKFTASLYEIGACSKEEAERLLSFSNNAGPAFCVGAVGAGMFGDPAVGVKLWLAQFASALTIGFVSGFARRGADSGAAPVRPLRSQRGILASLADSVGSAALTMVSVIGFICFFSLLCRMLTLLPFFAEPWISALVCGALEFTSGLKAASELANGELAAALIIGWSGVSVHAQVAAVTAGSGLSLRKYFAGKLVGAPLTLIFMILLSNI